MIRGGGKARRAYRRWAFDNRERILAAKLGLFLFLAFLLTVALTVRPFAAG